MIKKISFILLFVFAGVSNLSAQVTAIDKIPTKEVMQDTSKVEVRVDGLACPFCAYGLEKKFKNVNGIQDFKIDLDKGLVTFSLEAGKSLTEEAIKKIVKEAGFTAKSIKIPKGDW